VETKDQYWKKIWSEKDVVFMTIFIFAIFSIIILIAKYIKLDLAYKTLIVDFGMFFSFTSVFFYYKKTKKLTAEDVGFNETHVKWIFVSFLGAIGVVAIGGALSVVLSNLLGLDSQNAQFIQMTSSDKLWLNLLNYKLLIGILIPIAEELYFRGLLFKYIRQYKPFVWSAIVSSLIFSSIHLSLASMPFTFLLGLSSAFLFEKTKSIFPSFFLHAAVNNLAANLILFSLF
jgi:hypothetical protein